MILSYQTFEKSVLLVTFSGVKTMGMPERMTTCRSLGIDPEVKLGVGRDVSGAVREGSNGAAHDHDLLHFPGEAGIPDESPLPRWSRDQWR